MPCDVMFQRGRLSLSEGTFCNEDFLHLHFFVMGLLVAILDGTFCNEMFHDGTLLVGNFMMGHY